MEKKEEVNQNVEKKETKTKAEVKKNEEVKDVNKKDEGKKAEVKKESVKTESKPKSNTKKENTKTSSNKATSKSKDKKENKKSKTKVIVAVIVAIVIIALVACGGYFLTLNAAKTSALKEIDTAFTALKSGDEELIKQYLGEESAEEVTGDNSDENGKEMAKIMLNHLNYEVVSTDASLNECTVKLNVSNKDLKTVFGNYMKKAFSLAFSQAFGKMTEDEMNTQLQQYFQEQYESEDVETISNEITVTMKKEDGKWKMNADENEVINAVLPGYKDVMESLSSMQD